MNELFFELIRVAIGTQMSLSRIPTEGEWDELYRMAEKQSMIGICFEGVKRCTEVVCPNEAMDIEAVLALLNLPEQLYYDWLLMALKVEKRNKVVNGQCVELQKRLAEDGFRSRILKGQGVAMYYPDELRNLRQSGDIDVWVDGSKDDIMRYVNAVCRGGTAGDLHVAMDVFEGTGVEVHFTPSVLSGKRRNRMLQTWFEQQKEAQFRNEVNGIVTPDVAFNVVCLLLHIFRHYMYEGIGLRQLTDYYFVLKAANGTSCDGSVRKEINNAVQFVEDLGIEKFASALMWVLKYVFVGADASLSIDLPFEPDEKRGKRLLAVVMEGGNFGRFTEKYKVTGWDKPWSRFCRYVKRNGYMMKDYPCEVWSNVMEKIRISR